MTELLRHDAPLLIKLFYKITLRLQKVSPQATDNNIKRLSTVVILNNNNEKKTWEKNKFSQKSQHTPQYSC